MAAELGHALAKHLRYDSESGAINQSFSNIVGTLVLQWKNKQTADQASWLVAEGLFKEFGARALISLKDPGSAFNTPTLGRDRQVSSMSKYSKADDVHINSGIPNWAFYEVATRIGGNAWDKPLKIWYESVLSLSPTATFQDLANATVETATRLYGRQSEERKAAIAGWATVGVAAG